MVEYRELRRDEIRSVWGIDRGERIENIFVAGVDGLVLRPLQIDVTGWEEGKPEAMTPVLQASFDEGGWLCGAFEGERLVGVAVLENAPFGPDGKTLQLSFLHVSAETRGTGVGKTLFERARDEARKRGALRMYVSASPTERTVRFYMGRGCEVVAEPEPRLFELEPEDIHLVCAV